MNGNQSAQNLAHAISHMQAACDVAQKSVANGNPCAASILGILLSGFVKTSARIEAVMQEPNLAHAAEVEGLKAAYANLQARHAKDITDLRDMIGSDFGFEQDLDNQKVRHAA